ncbi:nuclear transport factor 2 family protein [Flavobacterium sp. XN-5]|uniref:nuclear transport factor 2 family protein n=1 Tax=Flavobacterium sp. XN-5 TaxID=2599390 RepID=UPI0011CB2B32|nr:nuclear transport factor 2 family protein [Flavobacterium sp. XN-5]NGY36900.1 nuclear transport factor 2 family protein [Flavobacterium sp. XN-5]
MKKLLLVLILAVVSCKSIKETIASDETPINTLMDSWHKAAAEAQFDSYFNMMTDDAIFIGTDATENWKKTAFQAYAKPHFDKGKAWSFTALERHVYFDKTKKTAWFDELLNTQMKVCRGSGVLVKIDGEWKIKHYVLSMTIPNDNVKAVIEIKAPIEDRLILGYKKSIK